MTINFYGFSQSQDSTEMLQGNWKQVGYGGYLEIEGENFTLYDITNSSCQPKGAGPLEYLLNAYNIESITPDSLILKLGITRYKYYRVSSALGTCQQPTNQSLDPSLNFEVLWNTFNENYAYFGLREVNWQKVKNRSLEKINDSTTQKEFYIICKDIIDSFDDNHTFLEVQEDFALQENASSPFNNPLSKLNYYEKRKLVTDRIDSLYLMPNTINFYHKDILTWGKITSDVGYLRINDMRGFSKTITSSDSLELEDYWDTYWENFWTYLGQGGSYPSYMTDELKSFNSQIDIAFTKLSSCTSIIIDLRFNGGGYDELSLELLKHFIDKKTHIMSKMVWTGEEFSNHQQIFIEPKGKPFIGNVVMLTSGESGSATETMILGSMAIPQVVRIGDNTLGTLSDVLQKTLPNGWNIGLSNEAYIDLNNIQYEKTGIPPTIRIEYPRNEDSFYQSLLDNKKEDTAIQTALDYLINK